MRRAVARIATASTLVLVSLPAARARGQEGVLSPAYLSILSRYAAGERDAAVGAIASWPEARLRDEIGPLAAMRQRVRVTCEDCPQKEIARVWAGLPLRAGLMLHADAALGDWRAGRTARLQESAALEYARMMADDPRHAAFVRRFLEATVAVHHAQMRWGAAIDWSDRALKIVPDSAPVHLAVAAIEEMQGALVTPVPHGGTFLDPIADPGSRALRAGFEAENEARGRFAKAREAARRALAAFPASVEARLRLGRLAWRLGEPEEAKAQLDVVLTAGDPRPSVFLAHLFLGRLAEDDGRLEDARRSYEAALSILPSTQSAGVALSEVRHRLGDLPGARAALLAGITDAGRRTAADPYWEYPLGASVDALARLEALRREVAP